MNVESQLAECAVRVECQLCPHCSTTFDCASLLLGPAVSGFHLCPLPVPFKSARSLLTWTPGFLWLLHVPVRMQKHMSLLNVTSGLLWLLQILGRIPKHLVKAANRAAQKMFHHRTSELLWPGELPSCAGFTSICS